MKRRSFLSSILAAGMAPAIVKASSIMKIWVPPEREIYMGVDLVKWGDEDFTIESWMYPNGKITDWRHVARTRVGGESYFYINGVLQPSFPADARRITLE